MVIRERKASTVHVGNHPSCLSFSGCGFLGVYHVGVASCFKEHAPNFLKNLKRIYGCSAGSIVGAMLLNDVCCGEVCKSTLEIVHNIRSRYLGAFSPSFNITKELTEGFERGLPEDAHIRSSGRLFISLTRLSDMKNVIVSEYSTREELIDALLCSCFVPIFSGIIPPKYRGVYYVDGGLSNNLPTDPDTITISPWSGGSDICPMDDSAVSVVDINLVNTSVQMTVKNMYRFSTMFFPPEGKVLSDFCEQGFKETFQYLLVHGLLESPYPTSQSVPDKHAAQENPQLTTCHTGVSSHMNLNFYIAEDAVYDNTISEMSAADYVELADSGVSETFSTECSSNEDDTELLDPNHQDMDTGFRNQICTMVQSKLRSIPSVTVMKMHPIEEQTLILHLGLPLDVIHALEETYLKTSHSWCKPVHSLISICSKTVILQIPLSKSYRIACFLIENASVIPENMRWLMKFVELFVSMLHAYFQVKGTALITKLQVIKNSLGDELKMLSYKLGVLVHILMENILQRYHSKDLLSAFGSISLKLAS